MLRLKVSLKKKVSSTSGESLSVASEADCETIGGHKYIWRYLSREEEGKEASLKLLVC